MGAPVSRGEAGGSLYSEGPIVVATPAKAWSQIYKDCTRRKDLVWIGNGLLNRAWESTTVVVPHFGVLKTGEDPTTNDQSPPTYIYGKHTEEIGAILEQRGVMTSAVASWEEIQVHAAHKILWASIMWLLCHSEEPPLTLSEVHALKKNEIEALVGELYPALQSSTDSDRGFEETLDYIELYSMSMPSAIPSKELALEEIDERNGVWLRLEDRSHPQAYHRELLAAVTDRATRKH